VTNATPPPSGSPTPAAPPKPRRKKPAWLTPTVWTVSWISLLQDAASEMLYPIMPVFLNAVLGAPAAVVGAIEGVAEGVMALTKLLSPRLNRYLPRKLMVFLGYAGAALGKVIIALSFAWPWVMVGRSVDRVGKGLRSAPRDAILLRGSAASQRGRVMGFHRSMDTAGAVVGPLLALLFLALFDNNIRALLWIAVIPAIASTLLVLLIKDGGMRAGRARAGTAEEGRLDESVPATTITPPAATAKSKLPAPLKRLIAVLAIFSLINFPDALLLLHVSMAGYTATEVVGAYLIFNMAYALLNYPAGRLADRFPSKYIYALGLLCFTVTYAGLAFTTNFGVIVILLVIYGGFSAANDTVGKAWAAKLAPEHQQLQAQARLQGFSGLGILVAGIWAGLMWMLGPGNGTIPLLIAGGVALIVAAYIALFAPKTALA
jgi:MFS family permease